MMFCSLFLAGIFLFFLCHYHLFFSLSIEDRFQCASVCRRWHHLLRKWTDVQALALSQKHVAIQNQHIESAMSFKELEGARIVSFIVLQVLYIYSFISEPCSCGFSPQILAHSYLDHP